MVKQSAKPGIRNHVEWSMTAIFVGLVLSLGLAGCEKPREETPDMIVLHTGRLRGNVYPVEMHANAPLQHYPFLAGYVRDVRKEAAESGAEVLLIDLGDSLGGSFAAHATGSENMVAFFNALNYDAIALSNLDYGVTPETIAKLNAKVLNPFKNAQGQPATPDSQFATTLKKGDIPIWLAANFYGDTSNSEFPDRFPAWFGTTKENVIPLRDYPALATDTRAEENGTLSLLSWMKFESPDEVPAEFLASLREAKIDAIVAHRIYGGQQRDSWAEGGIIVWEPPVSLNILRNNGGFALARLDLKRDGDRWRVLRQELIPMTANTASADSSITDVISGFRETISNADAAVADLAEPLDQEAILRAYLASLAAIPGTDAVLYSKNSIRTDWVAGPLTASRIFNSLPWTSPLVQIAMTRDQFQGVTEELGLTALLREDAPADAPLTVTTSDFFSRLVRERVDLPAGAITPLTTAPSEFDFFVRSIRTTPEILEGGPPRWGAVANAPTNGEAEP